ncbi:hypothetical protein QQ045_002909 [Rhodiola kirilowii]
MDKECLEEEVDSITDELEGKLVVSLEDDDWRRMSEEGKWAIVVKLANGMPFNIKGLANVLTKIWNMENRVSFAELANNMALARFKTEGDMKKIRDGGPWLCMDSFIIMHDWCSDLAPEEFVMNRLGVWAQLHNLPVGAVLNDKECGEKLAGYIGKFIKVGQSESDGARKRFIRVRVEIEVDKPIITGFFLRRLERGPLWVSVKYERLPEGCAKCGRLCHATEKCHSLEEPMKARSQEATDGSGVKQAGGSMEGRESEVYMEIGERRNTDGDRKRVEEPATIVSGKGGDKVSARTVSAKAGGTNPVKVVDMASVNTAGVLLACAGLEVDVQNKEAAGLKLSDCAGMEKGGKEIEMGMKAHTNKMVTRGNVMEVDELDGWVDKSNVVYAPKGVQRVYDGTEVLSGSGSIKEGVWHDVRVEGCGRRYEADVLGLQKRVGPCVFGPGYSPSIQVEYGIQGIDYPRKEKGKAKSIRGRGCLQSTRAASPGRMKALAWNCRGLGQPRSVRELTESVRLNRPDLVGLQETKIEERSLVLIQKRLGFRNGFVVPRQGLSGGLALWWKEEVTLTILSFSKYHIDACVEGEEVVRVTVFYGEPVTGRRGITWDLLRRLHSQFSYPWIVLGDFNEVCFGWEVKGGRIRGEWQMRAFRETLMDCGLSDLGYKGNPFTFSNRRSGAREMKARLDRMLANNAWRRVFPDAQVTHITATSSDHSMILLHSRGRVRKSVYNRFRFEPMWIRNEEVGNVVAAAWSNGEEMDMTLANKLHRCSKSLSRWNSENFGKVGKRIRELKEELESIRLLERDRETIAKEADIVEKIDEWRLREEILWRQRSRVEWLKEGDRNTCYFHAKATQRKKSNTILRLQNEDGEWMTDERQIGDVIKSYFTNIFSSSRGLAREDHHLSFKDIQRSVTVEMAGRLCEPVSATEIQAAIFQMSPLKAPGPDGFHALFYQKFWHIIKDTVINKVSKVFEEGKMEEGMNDTLIVLIPKCNRPKRVEEFRPISLCNVSAKIVMKILANRLKDILPDIISEMQSAFVPGRLISDNILLAHEVMRYIRSMKRQKTGYFSIKTDMSKAYDRMEWSFLKQMMVKLGFPERWTRLVMECISSVRYKVKLNDLFLDIPPPERGLRQGDPLSPYLFLICSEWLSIKLAAEVCSKRLKGVRICHGAPMVSHLFFADDSIFFMKATEQNARRLRAILNEYEDLSGQRISAAKSEIVYSRNVAAPVRQVINGVFAFKEVEVHSRYLGLPLAFSHNKVKLFKYIIQNTWKRVMGWKELQLSAAGKEVMLKSVLQALPIYAMMCYKLLAAVCKRLAGIMRKFWWSNDIDSRAIHWTNQSQLSMPKDQGELFNGLERNLDGRI